MTNEEKIIKILENIQSQLDEHGQILKALEHKSDVNKAEHDNFAIQLARIEGSTNSVNEKVDKLSKDLVVVEAVTGKNMQDIAHLKAIKQEI